MGGIDAFADLGSSRYATSAFSVRPSVVKSFQNLPKDPYGGLGRGQLSGGQHRFRAYDDFRADWTGDRWSLTLLPHRPFVQSRSFNTAAGGIERVLPPLEISPECEVDSLLRGFAFAGFEPLHVKFHQIRVVTSDQIHGVAVVEGPHRDGHDWQIVGVCARSNIAGGASELMPVGGGAPFFHRELQAGESICNADAYMWHNATDIAPKPEGSSGYRDIFILAVNRWSHRKYGTLFEQQACRDGEANWMQDRPPEALSQLIAAIAPGLPHPSSVGCSA